MDIKSQLEALNDCDLYDVYLEYVHLSDERSCNVHFMVDELDEVMQNAGISYLDFANLVDGNHAFSSGDTFFKYDDYADDLISSNDLFDLLDDEEDFLTCIMEHQSNFKQWIDFTSEIKEKITNKLNDLSMEQLEQLSKIIDTY